MIERKNTRTCSEEGCESFTIDKTSPRCLLHTPSRQCSVDGCAKQRVKGGHCLRHGGSVPRCRIDGCTNYAVKSKVCTKHGARRPRCRIDGCTNRAVKSKVCTRHGADLLKCSFENCSKLPQGPKTQSGQRFCVRHYPKPLPDKWRCSVPDCSNWKHRNEGCTRHGGVYVCIRCNVTITHGPNRICRSHCNGNKKDRVEFKILNVLQNWVNEGSLPQFVHNRSISVESTKRPDFLFRYPNFKLILEVDEDGGHLKYNAMDEIDRQFEIHDSDNLPTIFIRYNPDTFKPAGQTVKTTFKERMALLRQRLTKAPDFKVSKAMTVEYLYYNNERVWDLTVEMNKIRGDEVCISNHPMLKQYNELCTR